MRQFGDLKFEYETNLFYEDRYKFCEGNQIQIGNNIYNNTGNYFLSLNSFQGCDSNFQISLKVFPTHQLQFDTAICEGESLNIGSTTFNQTGNYTVISKNQFGCDSIFKLGLTVHSKSFTNVDTTFCDGGKLRLGGIDYTQAGTYDQSYVNRYQCDSLVRIHLIQNKTYQTTINTAICSGNSFYLIISCAIVLEFIVRILSLTLVVIVVLY